MLAGKLAADVVMSRAANVDPWSGPQLGVSQKKPIQQDIYDKAKTLVAKKPVGVKGSGAIAFGGGASTS